jgi:hypothetical protein
MTTEKDIWFIAEHLCDIPHLPLLKPGLKKHLTRIDARTMKSEMVGHRKKPRRRPRHSIPPAATTSDTRPSA